MVRIIVFLQIFCCVLILFFEIRGMALIVKKVCSGFVMVSRCFVEDFVKLF